MSMADMLTSAGLSMYQENKSHVENAHCPQGRSGKPGTSIIELMKLSPNDWTEGPQGLMSLGDMLGMAGFPVEGRE
eukprot:193159-Karenia_brevis.AAC.1